MEEPNLVLKLCSLLLEYPQKEWIENSDLKKATETIGNKRIKNEIISFFRYLESAPYPVLCEKYVKQFDFSSETTLYLTYGIFGDNRERGPALVKLKMEFAKGGYFVKDEELPDYLPLFLEFASIAEKDFVQRVFLIYKKQIERLKEKLEEEKSPYLHLLSACFYAFEGLFNHPIEQINEENAG